jgi:O-antigen ligase
MALRARAALFGLLLLLPFEPRAPVLVLPGARLTLLEAAAAVALVALAFEARGRLAGLARRPPLPLLALGLYGAAHLASASSCSDHRDLAFKFALRMAAMAAFALVVAAQPPDVIRAGLLGLVTASALVALLAVAEGLGARFLDPFLAAFREAPFNVAGVRRASAGTEYPNLAAAFLMYGIVASAGLLSVRPRAWLRASALAAFFSLGLLFTYSRGALVATALGLLVIAAGRRSGAAAPIAALAALGLVTAGFMASGEAFRLRLGSEGIAGWYRARYEPAEPALALAPGERRVTMVTVTNTGSKAWVVSEDFHLACHWYDAERRVHRWDGGRTVLPRDLGPGESLTLRAELQAPASEGRFLLAWDMVHEHTTWFSEEGVPPAAVTVRVSRDAAALPPGRLSPPRVDEGPWRPSRFELWGLAVDLWRERPILGVGPDNFRRLYGPRAGRLSWDSRVYANNTLLEAAATTGLLGAAALAVSLAAILVGAWRRLREAATGSAAQGVAAALLGLAAGLAAQGLVDYILAFTGHYLLLGFVVGATSAAGYEARGRPPHSAVPSPHVGRG